MCLRCRAGSRLQSTAFRKAVSAFTAQQEPALHALRGSALRALQVSQELGQVLLSPIAFAILAVACAILRLAVACAILRVPVACALLR